MRPWLRRWSVNPVCEQTTKSGLSQLRERVKSDRAVASRPEADVPNVA